MSEKRDFKYFKSLYNHIQIDVINENPVLGSQMQSPLTSSDTSLSKPFLSSGSNINNISLIQKSLSTFGQSINGSYCFLSCDLSGQLLKKINGIEHFQNLEHLNLSRNKLENTYLLSHLKNLYFLDLSDNRISRLLSQNLSAKLVSLDLSSNLITEIPDISNLTYLKTLDLSHNNISSVAFPRHKNLEELFLSHNNISGFDSDLLFPSLQLLDVSFNQIFDLSAISALNSLKVRL